MFTKEGTHTMANLDPILRRPSVEEMTGLKRATIYKFMANGKFPKAVKISPKCVGWRKSDIASWLDSHTAA